MTFYRRPIKLTQMINRFVSWLASLGLTSSDTVTLEVKGRRSGVVRSNPVTWVEHEGERYLVSPRGESEWVRNVRAAGGLVVTSAGAAATSATAIGTAALGPDPSGTLTQMGGYAAGAGANIQSCAP